ncbi:hypothetical protein LTR28_014030, partial [Elasticomyces elasticus]
MGGVGADKGQDEGGKLKTLLAIMKKFIGVSDIAAVRFSLPAQLLEPIPNLDNTPALRGNETKPNVQTGQGTTANKPVMVSYLTEQTSHHPPVSAFYVDCPDKGISARGFDQLSAKFTGTNVKVTPGNFNQGIFVTLHRWADETYQMTHPAAYLGGFLRGSLYVSVADACSISCAKTGIKTILHYPEEGWLGKSQNKVEGVVYKCDAEKDNTTRIKDVNEKDVLGR